MENIKSPAYPHISYEANGQNGTGMYTSEDGFSKLEKAALMIAQGLCADSSMDSVNVIPEMSVRIAKLVLEEANK